MVIVLLLAALLRLPALAELPPGLHYDEAANAILAGDIGLRGARPTFISSYTGKEVLFFYLAGGLMRLVGESVLSLRLTAAFVGLLTVAVTYRVAVALVRDRRVALLAALFLAASFWHVLFSRLGFRAITQPLLQGLAVWWLFAAARSRPGDRPGRSAGRAWATAALAGLFLGLTGHTYLAARMFPVLLLLATWPLWPRLGRRLGVILGVALLVLSPLLLFFAGQPDAFWVRIRQVAPEPGGLSLGESALRSLGMFFVEGDPYWRFNLPGRPLFGLPLGVLFVLGLMVCVGRLARPAVASERAARLVLALAPLIMLLPTALAVNEIVPSNLRAIGLLPFVVVLPAVGFVWFWDTTARRLGAGWVTGRWATATMVIVLVPALGWQTYRVYAETWGGRADVFYESDADLAAVAAYLDRLPAGEPVFVAALHYRHPTVAFLSQQYEQVRWLPGAAALPLPSEGPATYVFPRSAPLPAWAAPYLATAVVEGGPPGPDGAPVFHAYRLTGAPPVDLPAAKADYGGVIELTGAKSGANAPGEVVPLLLAWTIRAVPDRHVEPFVHFEDAWGHRWSQGGDNAYPSEQWVAGDRLLMHADVSVPAGAPPGDYALRVGWFHRESGERLPVLDEGGRFAGTAAVVTGARVVAGPPPATLPAPPVAAEGMAAGLRLIGHEALPESIEAGHRLELAFWWVASAPLPPWRERLVLRGPEDAPPLRPAETINLADTRPVHGTLPFDAWAPPAFVVDRQAIRLPADLVAGTYHLELVIGDDGAPALTYQLPALHVRESTRVFDAPPLAEPITATFGGEIRLLGANRDGDRLTLAWQALAAPADDYTVFVHLLDASGACCLWQADAWPQGGGSPTGGWLPGQVVVDDYQIQPPPGTPPGAYSLEVGLYVAENGLRLPVTMSAAAPPDAVLLDPWHVP